MTINAQAVKSILKEGGLQFNVDTLKEDMLLNDQGIDSLMKMEVLLIIEEKYNQKITDEEADSINTLNDLATFIDQNCGGI